MAERKKSPKYPDTIPLIFLFNCGTPLKALRARQMVSLQCIVMLYESKCFVMINCPVTQSLEICRDFCQLWIVYKYCLVPL